MPKRKAVPIVPGGPPAKQRRKPKSPKKPEAADPSARAPDEVPEAFKPKPSASLEAQSSSNQLVTMHLSEKATTGGHAIAAQPDRSDKPDRFLGWMLAPLATGQFLSDCYEQCPVHLERDDADYFAGWFSRGELERQLRECALKWTEEIDVALYTEAAGRSTLNGEGVASAEEVWAHHRAGCSVRLSWPQRHSEPVWAMLAMLEERFGCNAGANVYLTPPGAQGFAPHWDDINAFVLQLEGTKRWRLYAPRSEAEELPRFSSDNLTQEELGPPIADLTLTPGSLLYLPRGVVHQAVCTDAASLHMTVSVGRQHSWRDLLELGVLGALESATMEHRAWRESLPPDFPLRMGVAHADADGDERRAAMCARVRGMLRTLVEELPVDAMCDQFLCRNFMHERLPPKLAPADAPRVDVPEAAVELGSRLRLTSRHAARVAVEDGFVGLYFHGHNTRVYRELEEPHHIDFALEAAPALEAVLNAYPKYVTVARLPADNDAMRLDIARALVEARAVLVRPPAKEGEAKE